MIIFTAIFYHLTQLFNRAMFFFIRRSAIKTALLTSAIPTKTSHPVYWPRDLWCVTSRGKKHFLIHTAVFQQFGCNIYLYVLCLNVFEYLNALHNILHVRHLKQQMNSSDFIIYMLSSHVKGKRSTPLLTFIPPLTAWLRTVGGWIFPPWRVKITCK